MTTGVIAVVPAYNPDLEFPRRIESLAGQVDGVIVVDDGSRLPVAGIDHVDSVHLVRQDNAGIAAALNVGVRQALGLYPDASHVLTVDQDSFLRPEYVLSVVEAAARADNAGVTVAAAAAGSHNEIAAASSGDVHGVPVALGVAQSGMLFPVSSLRRNGLFDDSLFIDAVETDWVLRALRRGEHVVLAPSADMVHAVGDTHPITMAGRPLRLAGRERRYSYHSAIRRYYITRNRVLVHARSTDIAASWVAEDTLAEARTLGLCLIFGPHRRQQAMGTIAGLIDGVRGRRGKMPRRWATMLGARQDG